MFLIVAIVLAFLCYFSVCFRLALFHPIKTVKNAVVDLYFYLKHRKWNEFKTGQLIAFIGLFGKGKTLSAVHWVVARYKRYNDKFIFDTSRMKWVTQPLGNLCVIVFLRIYRGKLLCLACVLGCVFITSVFLIILFGGKIYGSTKKMP